MTEHYPMLLAQQVQPSGVLEVRAPYDGKVLGSVDLDFASVASPTRSMRCRWPRCW
jgi:hypothetical protein